MGFMIDVSIVSAESHIYSGKAAMVCASGKDGELGIPYGHAQLLTQLKPGHVRVIHEDGSEELFYVSGGFLEVQPDRVTVLADSAERAADLDEAAAQEAVKRAQKMLEDQQTELDYAAAMSELAMASAQLQTIQELKRRAKR